MTYRPDIDGLRAVAVLAVVLFHAHVPGLDGGFVGVDIFFVISGYLICSLIVAEVREQRFSLRTFYERRCRRILPALLAMLAIVAALAAVTLLPPDLVAFSRSLLSTTLFVSNIFFWRSSNYFDGASQFKPLLHTWSLGVEEQFYIVMPLILVLIARRAKPAYGRWLLLLSGLSFAASVWGLTRAPTADFYNLPTRFWELATGALVALGLPDRPMPRVWREVIGGVGVVLCGAAITLLSESSSFPGWNALLPCLGAAAIIYQGRVGGSTVSRLLSTGPFVFIGQISYSLYLWHWPLLSLSRYEVATRELRPMETAGILLLATLAAVASWRFVERPFRERRRFNAAFVFASCAAGGLVMAIIGSLGIYSNGFSPRYPDFAEAKIIGKGRYKSGRCFLLTDQPYEAWRGGTDCFLTEGHDSTVLLWGDSYAAHYAPGIMDHSDLINVDVLQYTATGCPPIFGFNSAAFPNCRAFNDQVPGLLVQYHVRAVVMAGRWESLFKRGVDAQNIASTVQRLHDLGVGVYVIGQSPVFNNDVQVIFAKQGGTAADADAAAPLSFDRHINDELRKALPPGIFIDPLPFICEPQRCKYRRKGQFMVVDNGHLSTFGSDMVVPLYFPFVASQGRNGQARNVMQ